MVIGVLVGNKTWLTCDWYRRLVSGKIIDGLILSNKHGRVCFFVLKKFGATQTIPANQLRV